MKKFKVLVCAFVIVIYNMAAINSKNQSNSIDNPVINLYAPSFLDNDYSITSDSIITQQNDSSEYYTLYDSLVNEVKTYIKTYHKNAHDIIAESIVKHGLKNNIDICFMLSQAKIETCFGKAGIGRPTSRKSLFGVERRKYKTYDECVESYVNVLKKYYLVKGKTEQHLLKKYVSKSGHRYAQNPNYERDLQKTYNHIKRKTDISTIQQSINNL